MSFQIVRFKGKESSESKTKWRPQGRWRPAFNIPHRESAGPDILWLYLWFDRVCETEPKYYADGEDAFAMRRDLKEFTEKVNSRHHVWSIIVSHTSILIYVVMIIFVVLIRKLSRYDVVIR